MWNPVFLQLRALNAGSTAMLLAGEGHYGCGVRRRRLAVRR
jgi:hypothetical protein